MKWEDIKKGIKSLSEEEKQHIEELADKEPNPDCELCNGTGSLSMDDVEEDIHFPTMDCDCTKEKE